MKVFVDEDTGSAIGKALRLVGVETVYVGARSSFKLGVKDEIWLPYAGKQGMLVLSRNAEILDVDEQRALVVANGVGIVFLPQLTKFNLFRLIARKWDWLEMVDRLEGRPFAFRMSPKGKTWKLSLGPKRRKRRTGVLAG